MPRLVTTSIVFDNGGQIQQHVTSSTLLQGRIQLRTTHFVLFGDVMSHVGLSSGRRAQMSECLTRAQPPLWKRIVQFSDEKASPLDILAMLMRFERTASSLLKYQRSRTVIIVVHSLSEIFAGHWRGDTNNVSDTELSFSPRSYIMAHHAIAKVLKRIGLPSLVVVGNVTESQLYGKVVEGLRREVLNIYDDHMIAAVHPQRIYSRCIMDDHTFKIACPEATIINDDALIQL